MGALKEKKSFILAQQESNSAANRRIRDAVNILNTGSAEIEEWDEGVIRQLADMIAVLPADRVRVYLWGGMEIEQELAEQKRVNSVIPHDLPSSCKYGRNDMFLI